MGMKKYRNKFPIIRREINYLKACSLGTIPDVGVQAVEELKDALMDQMDMFPVREELRSAYAEIINANPEEIAITPNTSSTICRILNCFDYGTRNKLVVSAISFPAIPYACCAQRGRGAEVSFVPSAQEIGTPPVHDLRPEPSDYEKAIDEDTLMVLLNSASSETGFRQDRIEEIIEIAHEKGAYVFLDIGQTVGQFLEDFREIDADFMAGVSYKKLLCPMGNAFLSVKEELIEELESLNAGWWSARDPMERYPKWLESIGRNELSKTASRFELGHPRLPIDYVSLRILDWVNKIEVKKIENYVKDLLEYGHNRITEGGFDSYEAKSPYRKEQRSHLTIKNIDSVKVMNELAKEDIRVAKWGEEEIRISPHFYNTKEDIDEVIVNLKNII